jgi:hypothetical protein
LIGEAATAGVTCQGESGGAVVTDRPSRCGPGVRTRVWRDGKLEDENFAFEDISKQIDRPNCVVWIEDAISANERAKYYSRCLSLGDRRLTLGVCGMSPW